MSMLKILNYPDPRLQIKAQKVTDVSDSRIQQIVDDMLETLRGTENCGGLAATQLDINNPPYITVLYLTSDKDQPVCLINPEIIAWEGEVLEPEGCMSVYPDEIHCAIKRFTKVTAQALDQHGKTITIAAEGYVAKCIQHEIDHLNGTLYIDHLSSLKRQRVDKKIRKLIKQ